MTAVFLKMEGLFILLLYGGGGKNMKAYFITAHTYIIKMLKIKNTKLYKVKRGQTLKTLSFDIGISAYLLVEENGLKKELYEGQILYLPPTNCIYTVQAGDTKTLLCGSEKNYQIRNGTDVFYPGMKVHL